MGSEGNHGSTDLNEAAQIINKRISRTDNNKKGFHFYAKSFFNQLFHDYNPLNVSPIE